MSESTSSPSVVHHEKVFCRQSLSFDGRRTMKESSGRDDDVFDTTSWSEQINEQESDQTAVEFQVFA